jgi:two-component system, NarL family, invasion response regulator UvrY
LGWLSRYDLIMTPIRLLICDDHRIVREGLKQIFADSDDIQTIAEAQDGEQAMTLALPLHAEQQIDLVLLDIAMPLRDGLDVLVALKKAAPELPVLILSTYPERHYAVRALKLGASGYLNKSADPDELIAAIRKVSSGGVYVAAETAEELARNVGKRLETGVDKLSHREYQVYKLLTRGLSVSQIGAELELASNTVSTYRARILEKTATKNDVELAQYAASLERRNP